MLRKVRLQAFFVVLCCLGLCLFTACGLGELDDATAFKCTGANQVPTISVVSPNVINLDSLPARIMVWGGNFQTSSVVNVNGVPLVTVSLNSHQLSATLGTDLIHTWNLQPGSTVQVSVTTPGNLPPGKRHSGCSDGGTTSSLVVRFQ
jgi:hypothetical protein